MSQIIDFYNGSKPDRAGRSWSEIVSQTDEWLEKTHDYIQIIFPLEEPSEFNVNAPTLTEEDILSFQEKDSLLRKRLKTSLFVMLMFYGIELYSGGTFSKYKIKFIKDRESFDERSKIWISRNNHNYMRITRILKSLCLLGLRPYAEAFLECLLEIKKEFEFEISNTTVEFWRQAVE